MIGKNKSGPLDKILEAKMKAEKRLKEIGRNQKDNYGKFHAAWKSGKLPHYAGYNPFKKY